MRLSQTNVLIASTVIAATLLSASPVEAGPADSRDRHCVVFVEDDSEGVLRTGPEECFDTLAESREYAAGGGDSSDSERMSSQNTIGLHFTGTWYSGSSVRIVGTTCGGGVWFATGSWNNNIESSYHYCGTAPTRFWDYSSCSGSSTSITSNSHTLGAMNNRASCVQYG